MSRKPLPTSRAPAGSPRAPAPPAIERDPGGAVALRLAIGKDGLGIELARPATFDCLDVVELVVRLPNVRFPFDVTGGVAKFRHRRGELERLAVELDARRAARWAEPLLRGLLGAGRCEVTIAPRAFGATITLVSAEEEGTRALAFEVALVGAPELALVVHSARGASLPAPATVLAMRATATLLGDAATREGARFVIARAAGRIARSLLPDAGVRAPGGDDVMLAGSGESDGVLFVAFARAPTAPPIPQAATLANEATLLARNADDARFGGNLERARHLDVATLERAPRHPEIGRRIAEVDAHAGGRAEAAIATLRDPREGVPRDNSSRGLRGIDRSPYLGRLLADLLFESGDVAGAIAALLREGEREPAAAVAALCYARAAALASDPADALSWLDAAIARAPGLAELRWQRADRRLLQGRLSDARADFQELEALATGSRARYDVLRRAADVHRSRGLGADAATLYERALLYRPDDPETVAGLGAAIAAEGRPARGATLLARAIEIASAMVPPLPTAWMELELARVLGDGLGDRPAAIARLRAVADEAREAIDARGLEGRYRAVLGDASGATLAYARLRERAGHERSALPWLDEAARFEEGRGELQLAQSHLAAALAIAPNAPDIEERYRALSRRFAIASGVTPAPVRGPAETSRGLAAVAASPPEAEETPTPATPEEDEERVEALTRTLQGDPTNDVVVDELVVRLTRLGRSMELLALLSARIEDAPEERREALLPRHRAVLERLEKEARDAGREGEADLFKMAREATA